MKKNNTQSTCQYCGAPIVSEICAYCGNPTGLNTANANMEFAVLDCKAVVLSFWTIGFPMIFAGAFGVPGLIMLLICIFGFPHIILGLMGSLFFIGGLISLMIVLKTIIRYINVKRKGKSIQGTVYGYMDDNFTINGQPAQTAKILVQTVNGPHFILYKLGTTIKKYGINDKVNLKVYQNHFMICNNTEFI